MDALEGKMNRDEGISAGSLGVLLFIAIVGATYVANTLWHAWDDASPRKEVYHRMINGFPHECGEDEDGINYCRMIVPPEGLPFKHQMKDENGKPLNY